jgi:protein-S-isoprenylcysteine O-methyltransferase Ste14
VRPLVYHDPAAAVLFQLSWIGWVAGEIVLARRTHRRGVGDRSYALAVASMFVGIALGSSLANLDAAQLPAGGWVPVVVGLTIFAAGLALRAWSVATLGRFFTVVVFVQEGQQVVESGPYRFVRHPSYTGLLLALLGFGITLDSWASVAACTLIPLAALLYRISVEERALLARVGDSYRVYASHRRRLVPGIW